ncbi:MAG: gamma-glutamyltransferase [Burkholderiales bacterium]|nr:gamma-glutamyltransferase [Burkholderiales bacterium]
MNSRAAHGLRRAAAAALLVLWTAVAAAQPIGQPEAETGRGETRALDAARQLVVAANPYAAEAGLEILRAGGSAVDAAVAVQLVLGLVEPQSSGLGGGGFLLHWSARAQRVRSYDGRETAPAAAREDRFVEPSGRTRPFFDAVVSGESVGVPGLVRLLELAHARHGRLPWARLFAPAIALAEGGFVMSPRLHGLLEGDRFLRDDAAARALYYRDDGAPHPVGTRIVNAAYAATLRTLAAEGANAFYSGPIAEDIVRAVRAAPRPGDMTLEDLANYRALERAPVCGTYRARRICGMGPPSAGAVVVLQILGVLERSGFAAAPPGSAEALHLFSEAGRLAYADRNHYIADPAFAPQPVDGLLAPGYLDARAKLIGERSMGGAEPGRPAGIAALGPAHAGTGSGTTHFSIVDAEGNALAMSASVENAFGARRMVRGFLLNNQLTDFAFDPRSRGAPAANRMQGGKRPRSTMAPTFVFAPDGSLELLLGSPGGRAIANYVAKVIVGVLDWELALQAAVELPNFGSTNGPTFIERGSAYESLAEALEARGHVLNLARMTSGVHAIRRIPGGWRGAADPRREGVARGD